jgi:putative DNA methylase
MPHPPLLIESWMPIEAIGAESKRERGASSALPPLYFLHVWWARRPLIASRAAILAGVLPAWSSNWPELLHSKFPDEETYHQWFAYLCGVRGDPVQGRKLVDWARTKGVTLDFNPYGSSPRAFTVNPADDDLDIMQKLLEQTWGTKDLKVLDPFAGGGSIPLEAIRFGFSTIANELNPVATIILKATLDYPARFGPSLADDIKKWGSYVDHCASDVLVDFYPMKSGERIRRYLWVRSVLCPSTGKPIPLSPNWWLRKGSDPIAVNIISDDWMKNPTFEIIRGNQVKEANADIGTIIGGAARSPWTGEVISGEYIKQEAQAGRMGNILYAVSVQTKDGYDFRSPDSNDLLAIERAEKSVTNQKSIWLSKGLVPIEPFPNGNDLRPIQYGMSTWADFFSSRQLLSHITYLECILSSADRISDELGDEKCEAILTYLAFMVDKCINYDCYLSSWHAPREVIRSVFDRHDFSFKWTFAEMTMPQDGFLWAADQIADSYRGISELTFPTQQSFISLSNRNPQSLLSIRKESASDISGIKSGSVENITVDPPYYDNVQYAELSDFFYVWLKRSVGHLFPEFFSDELTNKDDEAVANPARFEGMGKSKKELAKQDYENKMLAAFREMYRILHPDGCLTVMFTHKKVEAWDTLATSLINAGFTINASWPIHTESEHSLHQAKKNAASSTILLACRKRENSDRIESVWWDDLQGKVRQTARQKAEEFAAQGMHGVDLYLSTFGPTLSIISEHWPVLTSEVDPKTGQPKTLRPETALDLAREEVIRLRKQGLLLGRDIQFDPITDWYLMAWDAFSAEQFPYDEARKLAIALGVDLDHDLMSIERLAVKKGEFINLQKPIERRKHGMVDEEARTFEHWIDAAHTAMMIYAEDGAGPCEVFLRESGLRRDGTFKALIQALLNAIPRTRIKGKFLRPEAETLENMRLAFFDDIIAPVEEEPKLPEGVQIGLWQGSEETEAEEDEE